MSKASFNSLNTALEDTAPPKTPTHFLILSPDVPPAAILDDQSACGRGERLALALARENINGLMEGSSQARVEVDVYELQKDSQYDTTDTSESFRPLPVSPFSPPCVCLEVRR